MVDEVLFFVQGLEVACILAGIGMKKEVSSTYQREFFPMVMTGISFALFVFVNLFVRVMGLEPFYRFGLLLGILVLCFACITLVSRSGRVSRSASKTLTIAAILLFVFLSWAYLLHIAVDEATTSTTDPKDYEKVLGFIDYPNNPAAKQFPAKIPDNAQEVQFSYHPAIGQGGEVMCLKYKLDSDEIDSCQVVASQHATWMGEPNSGEKDLMLLVDESTHVFEYASSELPSDLNVYVRYRKPYRFHDFNHGELGLTAISSQRNEILFAFNRW